MSASSQKKPFDRRVLIVAAVIVLIVGGGIGALAYFLASSKTVYIENAQVEAPVVNLSSTSGGTLRAFYVSPGQQIAPNTIVAQVGVELIKSTAGGLVLATQGDVGKPVKPGDTVVEIIDPAQLRIVGQLEENKGLADLRVGQTARFTVDAFGSENFSGTVDEISPTAVSGDVVFSVSDKRQEQKFDVKVRYDVAAHPELKNGMSAKIWVYKN